MDVDNAEDVKVYTMGPMQVHAETRKSPVVDGIVQRNHDGKELRFVTQLSSDEREYSRRVCLAFAQTICGFDLLRAGGKSYVIDVNGWSFVKNSEDYYDLCTAVLRKLFVNAARRLRGSLMLTKDASFENQWRLKGFFSVLRHGDRTPKLKRKFNFKSAPFVALLKGGREEIIYKKAAAQEVAEAARLALAENLEDKDKLQVLLDVLSAKAQTDDVKVQVKPTWNRADGSLDKLQCVCKWGGVFTHAGRHQARDLGENLRKDLGLISRDLLDDVKVYSASETRVVQTAEVLIDAFLEHNTNKSESKLSMEIRKEMLDDSNAAKEEMERVKKDLQATSLTLQLPGVPDMDVFTAELMHAMRSMRDVMRANYDVLDLDAIQAQWCCDETTALFRERWEKLFKEFCEADHIDLSKVSDLYDSLKYDALHNRVCIFFYFAFASRIFVEQPELAGPPSRPQSKTGTASLSSSPVVPSPWLQAAGLGSSSPSPPVPMAPSTFTMSTTSPSPTGFPAAAAAALSSSPNVGSGLGIHYGVDGNSTSSTGGAGNPAPGTPIYPQILRELFRKAKLLFDYVGPREYGVTPADKRTIGLLTTSALVQQILTDVDATRERRTGSSTKIYCTKESHCHTLLNLIYASGLPMKQPQEALDEIDYLSQISFEVYERNRGMGNEADKEFSVRFSFSPGAYCAELVDLRMDDRHAVTAASRRDLTDHLPLDEVVAKLRRLLDEGVAGGNAAI
ncbi:histidine phosphatase superfamily-domain-containing protein [Blastocladiella britannica]|nr:histidine phosphatase superfamily-domain-containing protein [Blastocladiella britannica]